MIERDGKYALVPPSGSNAWWSINDMEAMYAVVSIQGSFPGAEKVARFAWAKIVAALAAKESRA
jgi:hypothetical protein